MKAVHVYNTTPFRNGKSPAELFLGRRIQTVLPVHPSLLTPAWPNFENVEENEEKANLKMSMNYNRRHRAKCLPPLAPGDHVFVKKGKIRIPGIIVSPAKTPRSYHVKTRNGIIWRNRWFLIKPRIQPAFKNNELEEEEEYYSDYSRHDPSWYPPADDSHIPSQPHNSSATEDVAPPAAELPTVRRSGRTVRAPRRLIDEVMR